jgi:hypothetical protein
MTMKRSLCLLVTFASFSVLACGGAPPPPPEQPKEDGDSTAKRPSGPTPQVEQELGSIDQRAVERKFGALQGDLEKCHQQGRDRVEYMSGDVKIFMRVGKDGKVRYSYFEESTLGDRDTEKCILDTLGRASWPQPEGGEAEVRNGFGWGPGGERAPTPWGPEKVIGALDDSKDVKKDVQKCKAGAKGDFIVTAYVEPDDSAPEEKPAAKPAGGSPGKKGGKKAGKDGGGKFKTIGIVPPNKDGADKVDCIVDALRPLKLPTPGSYAAKVSFPI